MFYFYVLYSLKDNKLYKGFSANFNQRFIKHSSGGVNSTKHRRPLILIYIEIFKNKSDALNREKWSKSLEGGGELRKILISKNIINEQGVLNLTAH